MKGLAIYPLSYAHLSVALIGLIGVTAFIETHSSSTHCVMSALKSDVTCNPMQPEIANSKRRCVASSKFNSLL